MLLPHLKLFNVLFEMRCILLASSVDENSIKKVVIVYFPFSSFAFFFFDKVPDSSQSGMFLR